MTDATKTLCPYCGVGCGLEVLPPALPGKPGNRDSQENPIWKVQGDRAHPSSQGRVCVKGATIAESLSKDRLLYPIAQLIFKVFHLMPKSYKSNTYKALDITGLSYYHPK